MKKSRKIMIILPIAIVITIIIIGILTILPISAGKMPPITTPNGISERAMVPTDDGELEVMLLSENSENPVLIVCGGGPGIPQYLLEYMYPSPLPAQFTVCYWDYRGTGLNVSKCKNPEDMTTERYMADTLAVTDYLISRFSQEKIYIMGHSFGTYVALKTVQAYPEKYKGYFAMSQIVDQKRSEYLAFDYMKDCYEKSGNTRMLKEFAKYDIKNSREDYEKYFFSGVRDKAMHELGVGTARDMHDVIKGIFLPSLRCKTYTQAERIMIWKGKIGSKDFPVDKDSTQEFNAFEEVPKVEVPIYFLVGKFDYTCCASLQREYYEALEAPYKVLYEFENSAHSPVYEEPAVAKEILRKQYP